MNPVDLYKKMEDPSFYEIIFFLSINAIKGVPTLILDLCKRTGQSVSKIHKRIQFLEKQKIVKVEKKLTAVKATGPLEIYLTPEMSKTINIYRSSLFVEDDFYLLSRINTK